MRRHVRPVMAGGWLLVASGAMLTAGASRTITVSQAGAVADSLAVYDSGLNVPACAISTAACDSGDLLKERDNIPGPIGRISRVARRG